VGSFQTLCTNQEEHMRTYKIAAMGGDGIGPEVVEAGVQVLGVCAERDGRFTLDFQDFDWGSDYYRTHGVMMPAKARNGLDYSVVAVGARIEYGPCGTRHAGSELAVLIGD
jgi:isocitrate/isopropylmalate dehydrogenase